MPNDRAESECIITTQKEPSASESLFSEAFSLMDGISEQVRQVTEDVRDHFKLSPERAIPELLLSPLLLIYDATTSYSLDHE